MELNIDQIESILPHRYPFLLVDKITECVPGSRFARGPAGEGKGELGLAGQLAAYPGFRRTKAHRPLPGGELAGQLQHVARADLLLEPGVLHFYQAVFTKFQTREASLTAVETFCMEISAPAHAP